MGAAQPLAILVLLLHPFPPLQILPYNHQLALRSWWKLLCLPTPGMVHRSTTAQANNKYFSRLLHTQHLNPWLVYNTCLHPCVVCATQCQVIRWHTFTQKASISQCKQLLLSHGFRKSAKQFLIQETK